MKPRANTKKLRSFLENAKTPFHELLFKLFKNYSKASFCNPETNRNLKKLDLKSRGF